MPEHDTGVQTQSLYEYSADREFEFAGLRMPLRDLIELCPVKDDASRMTAEAIDRFTIKVYQASGEDVPEQFAHLLETQEAEVPAEKPGKETQQVKIKSEDKPDHEVPDRPTPTNEKDFSPNLTVDFEPEVVVSTEETEIFITADKTIARETHVPDQGPVIHESIFAPTEAKLAEVVAKYDALHRELLADEQSEDAGAEQVGIAEEAATDLQKSALEVTYDAAEVPQPAEIDWDSEVADGPEALVSIEAAVMALDSEMNESADDTSIQEVLADSRLGNVIARYESPDDLELDTKLEKLFVPDLSPNEAVEIELRPSMNQLVELRIRAMPDGRPEQKQRAEDKFEAIKEIAAQIAEIEVGSIDMEWRPEDDIAELKDELTLSARQLFELLDIPAEDEVIKHFVNRLIIEQLQEMKLKMSRESQEKGTHEQKLFEDNLRWLKTAANPQAWLIPLIGRLAVA